MDTPVLFPPRHRESVFLFAEVVGADQRVRRCRVRNLSADGICLEQPDGLARGERVAVTVGMIERVAARVMWVSASHAGLHFDRAIDPADARRRAPRSLDPRTGWGHVNGL